MEMMTIKKSDLAAAMTRVQKAYRLAGPVKTQNGHIIKELGTDQVPDLEYTHAVLSPKNLVFPQQDALLSFEKDESKNPVTREMSGQFSPLAVVGLRPCDAKAIAMLKLNFDTTKIQDPYFKNRYDQLTLVGVAQVHPDDTEFSSSCGSGWFDETFLDLLFVDNGTQFIGKVITPKGKKFANAAGFLHADDKSKDTFDAVKAAALATLKESDRPETAPVDFTRMGQVDTLELYDAPVWKDLAFACINCNTCTFVCPTCWCFDIQDEASKNIGTRFKLWDSCMSDQYSVHASGHNPRQDGWQRFRNRFMHKLKYFFDKYEDGVMCVGCGRCIRSCPVGIDIRTIARTLIQVEAASEKSI